MDARLRFRGWAAAAALVALVAAAVVVFVVATSYPVYVGWYRVLDERNLLLSVTGGSNTWCRVTEKAETDLEVRVSVRCTKFLLLSETAVGVEVEVPVELEAPLGGRTVRDGNDGHAVGPPSTPGP